MGTTSKMPPQVVPWLEASGVWSHVTTKPVPSSPGTATCVASGDPHYLTFDGALHHFMGTCTYLLTEPCWPSYRENNFVVSATNEVRDGNLEASYVKAVHVQVFDLKISLLKGRKVVVCFLLPSRPHNPGLSPCFFYLSFFSWRCGLMLRLAWNLLCS